MVNFWIKFAILMGAIVFAVVAVLSFLYIKDQLKWVFTITFAFISILGAAYFIYINVYDTEAEKVMSIFTGELSKTKFGPGFEPTTRVPKDAFAARYLENL
jgi:lipid-A-disaccharide synthase-like uncharacterized protein